MNELSIVAPVVASYLPTALLEVLAIVTNRLPPDIAMLSRNDSEEMKRLLMGAPVVASYLPIVSLPFTTNRFPPNTAMPPMPMSPPRLRRDVEAVDCCPRAGVINANSVVAIRDKQFASGQGDVPRVMQP